MSEPEIATFTKGGQTPIEVSLRRVGVGIEVNVKILPDIEDFMKELGGGRQVRVDSYGRHWLPRQKGTTLLAYDLNEHVDGGRDLYRMDILGSPINYDGHTNLSFLRLVGASEGAGAGFYVKGVYSLDALRMMKQNISTAARQLFIDYIRPIDMIVKVSTQEVRL
jgi:hypothetical protein